MKLRQIAANQTEITTIRDDVVLFSYSTAVAAFVVGDGYVRTEEKYSPSTERHINEWLNGVEAEVVPQGNINALI
jgi:hypothetical protein